MKTERIEIRKTDDIAYRYYGEIISGSEIAVDKGWRAIYIKDGDYEVFSSGVEIIGERKKLFSKARPTGGELYGVNTEYVQEIKYGVGDINVIEKLTGKPITMGLSGSYKVQISNPVKLIVRLMGTSDRLTPNDLRNKLKSEVSLSVKQVIGEILRQFGRYELDSASGAICDNLKKILSSKFENYGVKLVDFTIENYTDIDDDLRKLIDEVAVQKYKHGQLKEVLETMSEYGMNDSEFSSALAELLSGKRKDN